MKPLHSDYLALLEAGNLIPVFPVSDPGWLLVEHGLDIALEHAIESLFAISNGYLGARTALSEGGPLSHPGTYIAGVFDSSPAACIPELGVAPNWLYLVMHVNHRKVHHGELVKLDHCRFLDMKQGLAWRDGLYQDEEGCQTRFRSMRLASLADRHVLLHAAQLTPENFNGLLTLQAPVLPAAMADDQVALQPVGGQRLMGDKAPLALLELMTSSAIKVAFAWTAQLWEEDKRTRHRRLLAPLTADREAWETDFRLGKTYRLERLLTVYTSRDTDYPSEAALGHLLRLEGNGDGVIRRHIHAWGERWQAADVRIEGDPELTRKLRFALYHLVGAANPEDERVSIGARMLTGGAYKGHVFWDTEIFMLPFYTFTHPAAARSLLMYRYHTLAGARAKARALGYRGALYAWESADSGEEATPARVTTPAGEVIPILCGTHEHHISADVAYAVWQYWQATQDKKFLLEAGAEILLETARFWASRVQREADGAYHIRAVIGPDEYHEDIDDNAYTNGMAQWNLERAADIAQLLQARWPGAWAELAIRMGLAAAEPAAWRAVAQRLTLGQAPGSLLREQFAGYFDLEDIALAPYAGREAPMDVILGRERICATQVIKQADVVMLLYLLWPQLSPAMRRANFAYYEPRCGHGSSLSAAIHALIAARLGEEEMARQYFDQAAEIDLANNMGNAAGGVHAAALGGLWQALVFGFAGMTAGPDGLAFTPNCPRDWKAIEFPVTWRGRQVQVRATPDTLDVRLLHGAPLMIAAGEQAPCQVTLQACGRWYKQAGQWYRRQAS